MNPFAVIEHIPASWDKIDICIYHTYEEGFRMNNTCEIKILPMSRIEDTFEPIWDCKWPLPGHSSKPKNKMLREPITTLTIPQ